MPAYRIYLLDPNGKIATYRIHECATDEEALQHASSICDTRYSAAEVWLRERMIGKAETEPPASSRRTAQLQ